MTDATAVANAASGQPAAAASTTRTSEATSANPNPNPTPNPWGIVGPTRRRGVGTRRFGARAGVGNHCGVMRGVDFT